MLNGRQIGHQNNEIVLFVLVCRRKGGAFKKIGTAEKKKWIADFDGNILLRVR